MEKLPEKWCIACNKVNAKLLGDYYNKQSNNTCYSFELGYLHSHNGAGENILKGAFKPRLQASFHGSKRFGFTEITFEDFKRLVLNTPKEDDKFVLPKKWYIEVNGNSDKYPDVRKWRGSSWGTPGYMRSNKMWSSIPNPEYTKITLEQFKKYVFEVKSDKEEITNNTSEFKLPKKWYLEVPVGKEDIIHNWRMSLGMDTRIRMKYVTSEEKESNRDHEQTITFEQFKKYVLHKDVSSKPSKTESKFVLPKKWCVNRENSKLIQDWFTENVSTNRKDYSNQFLGWYTHWPSWGGGNSYTKTFVAPGYTEISHNQFVAFVLNKEE